MAAHITASSDCPWESSSRLTAETMDASSPGWEIPAGLQVGPGSQASGGQRGPDALCCTATWSRLQPLLARIADKRRPVELAQICHSNAARVAAQQPFLHRLAGMRRPLTRQNEISLPPRSGAACRAPARNRLERTRCRRPAFTSLDTVVGDTSSERMARNDERQPPGPPRWRICRRMPGDVLRHDSLLSKPGPGKGKPVAYAIAGMGRCGRGGCRRALGPKGVLARGGLRRLSSDGKLKLDRCPTCKFINKFVRFRLIGS